MTEDFISYEKYEEVCETEDVVEEDALTALIDFLTDLGIVLHFETPVLRETNVINPRWATGAVYKILNSKQLADGKGVCRSRTSLSCWIGKFIHGGSMTTSLN